MSRPLTPTGFRRRTATPEALAALVASQWPGNVRQLRQVVTRALVRSMSCDITIDDLPAGYRGAARGRHLTGLERAERQALLTAFATPRGTARPQRQTWASPERPSTASSDGSE